MSRKEALTQFIQQIHGRPVVVKLNSGVDYRGNFFNNSIIFFSYLYPRLYLILTFRIICRINLKSEVDTRPCYLNYSDTNILFLNYNNIVTERYCS